MYRIVFFLLQFFAIQSAFVQKNGPQDTQHASCNIITKEMEATAKATVTRKLDGVCSKEQLIQFHSQVLHKLDEIKTILKENGFKIPQNSTEQDPVKFLEDYDYNIPEVGFRNLPTKNEENSLPVTIAMFNDTIVETEEGDVYYYYWKIENIQELLQKNNIYISSPNFSALGHTINIHFYPNLEEHIGLQLKPQSSGFIKKHKFTIIDQKNPSSEVSSKVLSGLNDDIFKIYLPTILRGEFIVNNSLLIKLTLLINS